MMIQNHVWLAVFRNPVLTKVFFWVTLLGKWQVVTVFMLATLSILWMQRRRWHMAPLLAAVVGSETFTHMGKQIFERPRPLDAVYLEHSYSFPSGHATIAVAFYGFLTYILMREAKKWETSVNVCFAGAAIVLLIGFSRLYLGVHYLSDVWGGYLVGALWLIVGISLSEWLRSKAARSEFPRVHPKGLAYALAILFVSVAFYAVFAFRYTPSQTKAAAPQNVIVRKIQAVFTDSRLKYTETITGEKRGSISVVIIAKDDTRLVHALEESGWNLTDDVGFSSLLKMARLSLLQRPYPIAPISPSFWNTRVNGFAFRRADFSPSGRNRHFTRFWKTRYITLAGRHLYVATVSVHRSFFKRMINTNVIDANRERELLLADLKKTKVISSFEKVRLADPTMIESFFHGRLFSDGFVYVIWLS